MVVVTSVLMRHILKCYVRVSGIAMRVTMVIVRGVGMSDVLVQSIIVVVVRVV